MLRERRIRLTVLGIAVVLALLALRGAVLDGPGSVLLMVVFPNDTTYAPGYSHRGFLKISQGMTQEQVRELVGAPLKVFQGDSGPGSQRWIYSERGNRSLPAFRNRHVLFDTKGQVTKTLSRYWVQTRWYNTDW